MFEIIAVFMLSFLSLIIFRKIAFKIQLVDKPTARKQHKGSIPLVGGLSIFSTVTLCVLYLPELIDHPSLYLTCSAILIFVGAIDDKYDINFIYRLIIQALVSLSMIFIGDLHLHTLGNLLGTGDIILSWQGSVITVLAVIGAINAFNMVDGINGLLGGLACVTFLSLSYLFWFDGQKMLAMFGMLFIIAIIPYVLLNIGFPFGQKFKIFMGDAGSTLIGFSVVWLLINGTQEGTEAPFQPVTALWIIALPLMDMAATMIRRLRKGQSPFKPDREHLHHICQRLGLSSSSALMLICTGASILAAIGIWAEHHNIAESFMFYSFLALFSVYYLCLAYVWRITSFIKKIRSQYLTQKIHQ